MLSLIFRKLAKTNNLKNRYNSADTVDFIRKIPTPDWTLKVNFCEKLMPNI